MDLECNLAEYDKILHGLIDESTASNDPDCIQNDIDQLNQDIDALAGEARNKELEWNNILYLKKMKEDMLLRIMRKKTVMDIMSNKINDDIDGYNSLGSNESNENDGIQQNSVNANNHNLANSKTTMGLAVERLNMNSSDLAKERSNINRMHRFVFCRNFRQQSLRIYLLFGYRFFFIATLNSIYISKLRITSWASAFAII